MRSFSDVKINTVTLYTVTTGYQHIESDRIIFVQLTPLYRLRASEKVLRVSVLITIVFTQRCRVLDQTEITESWRILDDPG